MKREEMKAKVDEELKHIPRIEDNLNQNFLRSVYNGMRRHDLSLNPATPPESSFLKAVEAVRKDAPNFLPLYDRDFFRV